MLLSITFSGGPRIVDKSADEVEFLAIQSTKKLILPCHGARWPVGVGS